MNKLFSLIVSLFAAAMLFSATAASAANFSVTLTQPAAESVVIVRSSPWRCTGAECTSNQVRSRPAIACGAIARELGSVTAFAVDAVAFTTEELAECNEYARQ